MIEMFTSLTLIIFALLFYLQRKTLFELEEEVWFLEKKFKEHTGKQPPRMERKK